MTAGAIVNLFQFRGEKEHIDSATDVLRGSAVFAIILLLLGVVWLYFWLIGNWFAAVIGMIIGAGLYLFWYALDLKPGEHFNIHNLLLMGGVAVLFLIPHAAHEIERNRKARTNLRVTLRNPTHARFQG